MPYASGSWGLEAKERSRRRLSYFQLYYLRNREIILRAYADNVDGKKDRVKESAKEYHTAHAEEIKLRRKQNSERINKSNQRYYIIKRKDSSTAKRVLSS